MPWVRLHGLRGYRDLPALALEHGLAGTINLVPSLCDQLHHYLAGGDDPHLALSVRPAESCGPTERLLLRGGFLAGHPAMLRAHPACAALQDRLTDPAPLSVREVRDLQVWATLAWIGPTGLAARPELQELKARGTGFSEADKDALWQAQAALLAEIPVLWRRFASTYEVSASPAFHPILPLLVDLEHARRCLPDLPALPDFRYPSDAALQLVRGKQRVEREVGCEVHGLWPSEGSVSPEVAALARDAGFVWLASDEEVWRRSAHGPGSLDEPWLLDAGPTALFRDHGLSDHIGFRTAGRGEQAAEELVAALRERGPTVLLALDGENPWESHADGGAGFLQALARSLDRSGHATSTCGQAARGATARVHSLHTGSWIGGDFRIWAGDAEDHAAWRLLADARAAVAVAGDPPDALEPLLAAEGSDWFWWYGPEFDTAHAAHFDGLFRAHLQAAWRALGREPPPALSVPVTGSCHPPRGWAPRRRVGRAPRGVLDWTGAGFLPTEAAGGAMGSTRIVTGVSYLEGPGTIWLRLHLHGRPSGDCTVTLGDQQVTAPLGAAPLEVPGRLPARLVVRLTVGTVEQRVPDAGELWLAARPERAHWSA